MSTCGGANSERDRLQPEKRCEYRCEGARSVSSMPPKDNKEDRTRPIWLPLLSLSLAYNRTWPPFSESLLLQRL